MRTWDYRTQGNGARVTIYSPWGATCLLQGDDAAEFMRRVENGDDVTDLCAEFEDVCAYV